MEQRSDHEIMEYAKTISDKYPNLTFDQIYSICRSPFKLVAKEMMEGTLRDVRIKYLGVFCVFPGRVKGLLNLTKKNFKLGHVNQDMLNERISNTKNYCNSRGYEDYSLDETT